MIQPVTPHELAVTADRLRRRVAMLRDHPTAIGLDDLHLLANQAQLMHCPTATQAQMMDAAVALTEARFTLENHP